MKTGCGGKKSSEMEATDPLEGLPPELMLHVLSFLSPSDLGHATCVSHAWLIFGAIHFFKYK
jgi:hypothetical protein